MMNDRFSVELRQHLLATADERPGDGRLEAIVEGVSVTRQSHPLLGHLPWAPRRTDLFPSAVVRYGLIAAALIVAMVAAALFAGNAGRRTVFEGTWTSVDPGDGSTQTLVVGGGPDPAVHFEDEFATGLACRDADVKIFTMDGLGTVVDDRLDIVWPDGGGCGPTKIVVGPGSYAYDATRDTIIDRQGLTWARLERASVPPTSTPSAEPALPSPTADPDCIDFDAPGTYTAPAGSLSLTVSVPRSVGLPWHGHRDRFDLMRSRCADERGGPGLTIGAELTRVYTDACAGVSVAVDSAQAAIDAVSAAKGLEVLDQTQVTLGGYPGTRFDVAVSDRLDACPGQEIWLSDDLDPFGTGLTFTLYVIDVDGKTLALALYGTDWSSAVNADVNALLGSMRIEPASDAPAVVPTPATSPTPVPTAPAPTREPQCFDVPAGDTYRYGFEEMSLAVTVPLTARFEWQGYRDGFEMAALCHFARPVPIAASIISVVHPGCDSTDGIEVTTPAEAVARLTVPEGYAVSSPTAATIAGHQATRFEISLDAATCRNGIQLWNGRDIAMGTTIVYVVDVDGIPLGITITNLDDAEPARQVAEAEAMVASMTIEPVPRP